VSKNINEQTKIYKGKIMTNVFRDQEKFMRASDQSVENFNQTQFKMYLNLIKEEYNELLEAQGLNQNHDRIEYLPVDEIETLDALIDILVVTIGAIHSMGSDAEGAWKEVMSTNFAKIDKETGKVRKREDGKVLKPVGWVAPNLESFIIKETK
jgi:predicted HAD superfamily Cof-like phosphohydrolase